VRLIVVVPSSQTIAGLTTGDVRRIYLGDMTRWPDGRRIVPVMLKPGSSASDVLLKRLLRISAIDFAQQWIGAVFRGRVAAPPVTVANTAEAIRFVETHADAVAVIVEGHDVPRTLRVLPIDERAPASPQYPLSW
jgi:hypothetical protein